MGTVKLQLILLERYWPVDIDIAIVTADIVISLVRLILFFFCFVVFSKTYKYQLKFS